MPWPFSVEIVISCIQKYNTDHIYQLATEKMKDSQLCLHSSMCSLLKFKLFQLIIQAKTKSICMKYKLRKTFRHGLFLEQLLIFSSFS